MVLGRPNTKVDRWTSAALDVWIPLTPSTAETPVLSAPGWTSCTSSRMCEDGMTDEYRLYTLALWEGQKQFV